MADPDGMDRPDVNVDALKSEIRRQLINQKVLCSWPWLPCSRHLDLRARLAQANACPIAMRMAWHAAGTYDKSDKSGGCNGAPCARALLLSLPSLLNAGPCTQNLNLP
jgi:hypothetical protein